MAAGSTIRDRVILVRFIPDWIFRKWNIRAWVIRPWVIRHWVIRDRSCPESLRTVSLSPT